MTTELRPLTAPVALPPAGPAWYGAVMGTGILATLTQTLAPGSGVAPALLAIGWILLVGLTGGFAVRSVRVPGTLAASIRVGQLPLWGMVSMGVLSIGPATATVLPAWIPTLAGPAVLADVVLWIAGHGARVGHCYRIHGPAGPGRRRSRRARSGAWPSCRRWCPPPPAPAWCRT